MTRELTLLQVAKYNENRTPRDHDLIYAMAEALGTVRYVEQTGRSYMKGASCLDEDGVDHMFVTSGRAYIRPESVERLTSAGIAVKNGKTAEEWVVLFSNAGGSHSGTSKEETPPRPGCPQCGMELSAAGQCVGFC